jgi:hypothetical protein
MCALGLSLASAGTRPQVDLSVNVRTTPEQLVSGGIVTVTMTVHNNGPDTAGGVLPNERDIIVYERPYDIVSRQPPFLLFEPAIGCSAYAEESEYIPGLPGGGITLMFSYWFDAIPSGESRACTYRLQVLPTTIESFDTYWMVRSSNDDDINPSNNRLDYTFVTAPPAPPISVPAGSPWGWILLSIGFSLIAWQMYCSAGRRQR